MADEMTDALERLAADSSVRVLILRGAVMRSAPAATCVTWRDKASVKQAKPSKA